MAHLTGRRIESKILQLDNRATSDALDSITDPPGNQNQPVENRLDEEFHIGFHTRTGLQAASPLGRYCQPVQQLYDLLARRIRIIGLVFYCNKEIIRR